MWPSRGQQSHPCVSPSPLFKACFQASEVSPPWDYEPSPGVASRREMGPQWTWQSSVSRQNVGVVTKDGRLDSMNWRSDLVLWAFHLAQCKPKALRYFGILTQQHGKRSKHHAILCMHVDIKAHSSILKIAGTCLPGPKWTCAFRKDSRSRKLNSFSFQGNWMTNNLGLNPIDEMMILVHFQLENDYRTTDIPESAPCWPKEPIFLIAFLKDDLTTLVEHRFSLWSGAENEGRKNRERIW